MGRVLKDSSIAIKEIESVIRLALSKPTIGDLSCEKLLELIDFRDEFLFEAIELCVEALPKLILDSPLATGKHVGHLSTAARSIFEPHPQDTGMYHLSELLGYFPTVIAGKRTPWEKQARECFPHWQWFDGPYQKFHANTALSLRITPAAIVLRKDATDLVWSENKGYRGKLEEVTAYLLNFKHELIPGNVILISRWGEEDDQWQEKRETYRHCAKECGLLFCDSLKHVRLELPMPQFLKQDAQAGTMPLWAEMSLDWLQSLNYPVFSPAELNREIVDQSSMLERRTKKKSTSSTRSPRKPPTSR